MKEEIAKEWVKALRSGKYKQGKGALCEVQGKTAKYCCLGVLCHILNTPYTKKVSQNKFYCGNQNYLPFSVVNKAGMKNEYGNNNLLRINLAAMNDQGKPFKEIADVIEQNWMNL